MLLSSLLANHLLMLGLQQSMIKLLARGKLCLGVTCESSLDDSSIDVSSVQFVECPLSEKLLSATGRTLPTPGAQASVTQVTHTVNCIMCLVI